MIDRMTCLLCPAGCELEAREEDGRIEVSGQECDKGAGFAESEIRNPMRNLATSVPIRGSRSRMVSVRLSGPVPRDRVFPILEADFRPAAGSARAARSGIDCRRPRYRCGRHRYSFRRSD